ncbi:MAG: hypothetical protein ACR2MX_08890 [Cyclobacteriaceae bacterium]
MKVGTKIGLAEPRLYLIGMLLLIILPYCYPQHHFLYQKVASYPQHFLVSGVVLVAVMVALVITLFPSFKLRIRYDYFAKEVVLPRLLVQLSWLFIWVAIIMNILIVAHGIAVFDGNIHTSKQSLEDFGGINIISQFYMFFTPIVLYDGLSKGSKHVKYVMFFLGAILLLRTGFLAERVAFLEFLVPVLVTLAFVKKIKISLSAIIRYTVLFLLFFVALELTRQFYIQYIVRGDQDVDVYFALSWSFERFFAYYADTQNKLYFLLENNLGFTQANYLYFVDRLMGRVGGVSSDTNIVDFGVHSWQDFTNIGGLSALFLDFSYFGIVAFVAMIGCFLILWKKLKQGSAFALAVYPHFVVGILELPRYVYFYLTRFVFAFILFVTVYSLILLIQSYVKHSRASFLET